MKRILVSIIALMLAFNVSLAQNGGLTNENSVVRLDYIGFSGGIFTFRAFNLQPCQVNAQYMVLHTNQVVDYVLPGNGSYDILVPGTVNEDEHVKTRIRSFCPCVSPDQGWVEQDNQGGTLLPIKLVSFGASKVSKEKALVTWTTADEYDVNRFEVQRSSNGVDFSTVGIAFPNNAPASYKIEVPLINGKQYFRLKTIDLDGKVSYSVIVAVRETLTSPAKVYVTGNLLVLERPSSSISTTRESYILYNSVGASLSTWAGLQPVERMVFDLTKVPNNQIYFIRTSKGETFKFFKN
jgi:hypothetical protein